MATGKVKSWLDERGFGFIRPDDGGAEVFVHHTGLRCRRGEMLFENRVSYELKQNPRDGRMNAVDVEVICNGY